MNAAASLPKDTSCARGAPPHKPDTAPASPNREPGGGPASRSFVQPGAPPLTPALLSAGPKPARKRHKNGHTSPLTPARSFRDVKPSAQPTLVRTQHLPPPRTAGRSLFPLRCGSRRGSGPPHRRPARYCVVLAGQRPRPPRGRGTIRCSTANTRRSSGPRHAARRRPIVGQERLRWKTGIRMAVGQSRLAAGSPRAAMTGAGIDRQAPRLSADHCCGCLALSRSCDLPQHRHPARRTPLPTVAIRQTPT
jgi:hypothetical protein